MSIWGTAQARQSVSQIIFKFVASLHNVPVPFVPSSVLPALLPFFLAAMSVSFDPIVLTFHRHDSAQTFGFDFGKLPLIASTNMESVLAASALQRGFIGEAGGCSLQRPVLLTGA